MLKRTWSWILGGLVLVVAPAKAGSRTVVVYPPYFYDLTALRLEVRIDGVVAGTLQGKVSDSGPEPTIRLTLADGFHRYAVTGEATLAGGRRMAVEGQGFLAQTEYLAGRLERKEAQKDPLAALEALLQELRAMPGAPALPRLERGPRAGTAAALAQQAKAHGLSLPATCAAVLERFGPFVYVSLGDEGEEPRAALYSPDRLRSVPDWRREVRRAPLEAGDTPKARKRMAELASDFVLGHAFDTVWTLRGGTHPRCPDGTVSLSGEFLYENDPAEDLWNEGTDSHESYFGDREPRCGDRTQLLIDNYLAAFVDGFEDVVGLSREGEIRLQQDPSETTPDRLAVTFGD